MKGTGLHLPRATVGVSRWRRFRAAVDWPLICVIIALCTIGLLNLYSATRGLRHQVKFDSQVQWMIVGAIAFIVVTIVDYRAMVRLAWIGLGVAIALMLFARIQGSTGGDERHGSTYRWLFLGGVALLLLLAAALVPAGAVKVKMLPFDNKSEFQVILNMPEGATLEETTRVARELAAAVRTEPEVRDYQVYAGTAAPFNFNGLVRHYFLRRGANVADLQVNLRPAHDRRAQSHEVAERVRPRLAALAAQSGAALAVAEVPPGPPVITTQRTSSSSSASGPS